MLAVGASISAAAAVAAYVTFSHLSHTEQLSVSHTNTCQQQHTHTHTYIQRTQHIKQCSRRQGDQQKMAKRKR